MNIRDNVEAYFKTHDTRYVAEDAVSHNMSADQEVKGRHDIANMLHHMYHIAFEAKAVVSRTIITESNAMLEANFIGKHIGDFAGIPPIGKQVNVPLCVTYDLNKDGLIQNARIYMLTDIMIQQLKDN